MLFEEGLLVDWSFRDERLLGFCGPSSAELSPVLLRLPIRRPSPDVGDVNGIVLGQDEPRLAAKYGESLVGQPSTCGNGRFARPGPLTVGRTVRRNAPESEVMVLNGVGHVVVDANSPVSKVDSVDFKAGDRHIRLDPDRRRKPRLCTFQFPGSLNAPSRIIERPAPKNLTVVKPHLISHPVSVLRSLAPLLTPPDRA